MKRILLVEDKDFEAKRVLALRDNFDIIHRHRGDLALNYLNRNPVDLVLLDLNLEDMHGYDILKKIREDARMTRLPVIILEVYLGDGRTGRRNVTFVHPTRVGNHHFMMPLTERNQSFFSDLGFDVQISVDGRNARLTRGYTFLDFSDQSTTIFRNYIAVAQLLDPPVYVNSTLYIPAEMFFKAIDVRTSFEGGVLVAHLHNQPLVQEDFW